jgi:hypothetical protein
MTKGSAAPPAGKGHREQSILRTKKPQSKERDGDISHEEHPEESQEKAFKPVDVSADS